MALMTMDEQELHRIKEKLAAKDKTATAAFTHLIQEANDYLALPPSSVMDKKKVPPSGDMHDFFAIGKYSWPNPNTPDGMPFIRRDGYTNPDAFSDIYDLKPLWELKARLYALSLAYFYSDDEKYAAKAAECLRTWFIDPKTRMNPHFKFASSQPGVHDGMPIGIIEGTHIIAMLDAVHLLDGSDSWTTADHEALRQWLREYTAWLAESDAGKQEAALTNNHGSWYEAQMAVSSLYSGDEAQLQKALNEAKRHIAIQFAPDGSMPKELRRNRSLHYSMYGLLAFVVLAKCGDAAGEDLWHYQTAEGRSIALGMSFLAPYLAGDKDWEWENIDDDLHVMAIEILHEGSKVYRSDRLSAAKQAVAKHYDESNWMVWLRYSN